MSLTDQLATAGNAIYTAKGILETEQETIIATRNATVAQTSVSQSTSSTSTSYGTWQYQYADSWSD